LITKNTEQIAKLPYDLLMLELELTNLC